MSTDQEIAFHLFDEREFRERFLPGVQGNEPMVREILDAAEAAGPSWTALHKVFDETRVTWQRATELADGELCQRTLFPAFGRVVTHLRPAFVVRGLDLGVLDREAPEVARRIVSPGELLREAARGAGPGAPLPGVGAGLPGRVPARVASGRASGGLIHKDDIRATLDAYRAALPRLVQRLGPAAEPGLTVLLAALVTAKLQEQSLLETADALVGDVHLPRGHKLEFERPADIGAAVRREVGRCYGRPDPTPAEPVRAAAPASAPDAVTYTPRGTFAVGQRVQHKAFGTGEVTQVLDSRRCVVKFRDEEKTLVQGQP